MAGLSLSAIGLVYSVKKNYPGVSRNYGWIAFYLFLAAILWFMVPLLGGQLLPIQTTVLVAAFLVDVIGAVFAIAAAATCRWKEDQ